MALQPYLIANARVGLERDIEPWLLPEDGFPELEDCYLFRGRVKKKQGYVLLGRLQRKIGTTNGSGNLTVTLPNNPITSGISSFIIGTQFIQDQGGASPVTMLTNGPGTAVLNRTTGVLTITGAPINTDVIYQPSLPAMGLPSLDNTVVNTETLMAFDTKFSYVFNTSAKAFKDASNYKGTTTIFTWSGSDSQFFWTSNYAGALWATNNVAGFQSNPTSTIAAQGDGIKWFDQDQSGWVNFLPQVDGSNFLMGSLIILPYKGRLLMLNTVEGPNFATQKNFQQRARWCQLGTPFYTSTLPTNWQGSFTANSWRSDITGFGGFVDAPTLEQIVSAQFVKDTLIVYFERSTWQLRYTGNELLPFIWEKINTELGATSTFSQVPFDKVVLGVGDVGIHACDSVNVERIDQRIPDEVFAIPGTNSGKQRVYGIRDFYNQLVYWSLPYKGPDEQGALEDEEAELPPPGVDLTFPNKILVFNYEDGSYSFYNDSFTCFGNYQKAADTLWSDLSTKWGANNSVWVTPTGIQQFPFIVAGNQQGFVEIFDPQQASNGDSLFISSITGGATLVIPNHNLTEGMFIRVTSASGTTGLAGANYKVSVIDANTITISGSFTGSFTGNGTVTVISNIDITTKRFNPFIADGIQARLAYIDFYVKTTPNGQFSVNLYLDEDSSLPTNLNANFSSANTVVNTFPETTYQQNPDVLPYVQTKLWKRFYVQNISQLVQAQITLNDAQMLSEDVRNSDFTLHAMIFWFAPAGRLINV